MMNKLVLLLSLLLSGCVSVDQSNIEVITVTNQQSEITQPTPVIETKTVSVPKTLDCPKPKIITLPDMPRLTRLSSLNDSPENNDKQVINHLIDYIERVRDFYDNLKKEVNDKQK